MDAHTRFASDYIRQCLAVLQASGADNVGGPWVAEGKGAVGKAIAAAFQSPFTVGRARGHDPDYEGNLDTVYLGCWRRQVFDRVGLFDDRLTRSEDDELNLRITRAGGRIWQSPRIKSWYSVRESLKALWRQCMHDGYWKVRVIQKHKIPASVRHLIPSAFVFCLIVLPLMSPWWPIAGWGWLLLIGVYLASSLVASFLAVLHRDWRLFPLLPFVFACYHFGYGYGFLHGVWDFIVTGRGPGLSFSKLTRTTPQ
jgi:succinoglycan biosynthesis protein ExoA